MDDKMRLGMIHQPHFLPWQGYMARCLAVDVFVVLDNVKFNKNHYQQRTRYVNHSNSQHWLTLPLAHSTKSDSILNVRIADSFNPITWQRPFRRAYEHDPYFEKIWNPIFQIIKERNPSLTQVNHNTITCLLDMLSASICVKSPEIVLASSNEVFNGRIDRTERLIEICLTNEITHLAMGQYALEIHDNAKLQMSGIALMKHEYVGLSTTAPLPGVTILHDMFKYGCFDIAKRLCSEWSFRTINRINTI